ncbi:MAG: DeoR/GlpR family DNA-binding transcription regulator [Atopobiaceae bacterium]|jgi:DeoR/GlpR family transcriptional regulator of sugar metabolism|nr:DeoR/GlpR family DNA-binding transcription regulator [Atopobiaceae bacterium]MCH4181319.1 DeoR/GlpR family DNA-binding transcription regulator [Atopobiaceae bacterium]MCH4215066.1 DeoR/GlpR family DNA-binding transcription regulator [Atopobiaceae bacterium]MCH4230618.1 DeoR/GlpR family DNA-binding transcription regulator [Atopobiaceae bacterium]MCH4276783.1 DeoR/GlpR family DNA-binding transcription regulator [Atopobiaceae bacterium]
MRNSRAFVAQRREAIASFLESHGSAEVNDLAERFQVSPLTIRRDLDSLAEQGILERGYGTATLKDPLGNELASNQVRAKQAIAREAARLVSDGDTIFINTSSTALRMIEFITAENVTVITNNGKALETPLSPTMTVLLTGGEIRVPKWSMSGPFALSNIGRVTAVRCFMGCNGISAEGGIATMSSQEAPVNSLMVERADQCVMLADHTKIGVTASFCYGTCDQTDLLITDEAADDEALAVLRQCGIHAIKKVPLTKS